MTDPLHPYGRCTCAGEGTCDWCVQTDQAAVLSSALARWGATAQMCVAQEECAELIVAISHLRRGRVGHDAVAEEIADVQLILAQMELVVGPSRVAAYRKAKVARLAHRLAQEEPT